MVDQQRSNWDRLSCQRAKTSVLSIILRRWNLACHGGPVRRGHLLRKAAEGESSPLNATGITRLPPGRRRAAAPHPFLACLKMLLQPMTPMTGDELVAHTVVGIPACPCDTWTSA